jgi:uncharacterized protein
MKIDVAQLLKENIGATRVFEYTGPTEIDGERVEISLDAVLTNVDGGVLVSANVRTSLPVTCVRCLEVFPCDLVFSLEEEYRQTVPVDGGGTFGAPSQPGSFAIDNRHTIDLLEAVRQNALLTVPMQPFCDPDCRGICPGCGINLNRGDCECD